MIFIGDKHTHGATAVKGGAQVCTCTGSCSYCHECLLLCCVTENNTDQ